MELTRHADHDPELPCRPANGNGLCYPVPASEQLVPWREALGALTQEFGPDTATVCVTHRCFVPCRAAEGCVISQDPGDVADVTAHQQGGPG